VTLQIGVAVFLLVVFTILAVILSGNRNSREKQSNTSTLFKEPAMPICPLCGSRIKKGEKIYSDILKGRSFDLMRIFGCRECLPEKAASEQINKHPQPDTPFPKRTCPSCGAVLSLNDYLAAKVFYPEKGKTNVQIYGCSKCRPGF